MRAPATDSVTAEGDAPARERLAPAKVNLALHVTGRRGDGYHTLDSLVAFADHGDRLRIDPSDEDAITVDGPFAPDVPEGDGNILLKALRLVRGVLADEADKASGSHPRGVLVRLNKQLPAAAGLGGGSADAAALLRHFAETVPETRERLREAALRLGADVPMCFDGVAARVTGIGEIGEPLARFPAIRAVLVNPRVPVSTPEVFRRLKRLDNAPLPPLPAQGFADAGDLALYLRYTRNDLEPPAFTIAPQIEAAKRRLVQGGALLARMSGSGASVFGLFADEHGATQAAAQIRQEHPDWWIVSTVLGTACCAHPAGRANA